MEKPVGNWKHHMGILKASFWKIIPPHGIRHQPGPVVPDPKQTLVEMVAKAKFHGDDSALTLY